VPTYTYKCTACEDVTEKRQSFSEPRLTTCERCGGALRKVIHPVGIVFKGSGWYITDSRSASSNGRSASDKSKSSESDTASKSTERGAPESAEKGASSPSSSPAADSSTSTSSSSAASSSSSEAS
jgi:putative FmdB family regulatory protein